MRSSMTGSSVWNLHRIRSISMASCIRFVCQIHGKETTVICSFYFCAVPKRQTTPGILYGPVALQNIPTISPNSGSHPVKGVVYPSTATVEHVGVDHRGLDIPVS